MSARGRWRAGWWRLGCALLAPGLTAFSAAAESAPVTVEQQAALKALDAAIARYATLVEKIDDPVVAETARAFLANYRERRDVLHKAYDATKHDELRFDVNVESHRLAQWLGPPRTPAPPPKSRAPAGR